MTDALSSLPDRPLKGVEFTALNHADAFAFALPVDREEAVERESMEEVEIAEAVVLGTDDWVKALRYDDGWQVVESVPIDDLDEDRFDAMQTCEDTLRDA